MIRSNVLDGRVSVGAAALSALLALTVASAAQASEKPAPYSVPQTATTFTRIDNPLDPTFNQLLGINNEGDISGYYGSGAAGHPNKGYFIAPPYTTFIPDNLPASTQTQATGLNNSGVSTGFWAPTNTGTDQDYGFIRLNNHGTPIWLSVNDVLVSSTPLVNQVLGVNDNSVAVGFYNDSAGNSHGFAYSVPAATFTAFDIRGSVSNAATGINNKGLVSGFFTVQSTGITFGYLKSLSKNGLLQSFRVPGSKTTQFLGVNNSGVAVGFYIGKDTFPHGVLFNPASGAWVAVNDPFGAQGTTLNGINDKGQVVGFYTDAAGNTHGVLVQHIH